MMRWLQPADDEDREMLQHLSKGRFSLLACCCSSTSCVRCCYSCHHRQDDILRSLGQASPGMSVLAAGSAAAYKMLQVAIIMVCNDKWVLH
eukprot:XP_025981806.1 uncharacterized protein LOC112999758 isoform X2 [Glycine max]